MKQFLIDKFVVPEDAVEEFTERMNYNRKFIKKLPGFVEDATYERSGENGSSVIVTIATWESIDSLNKAKEAVEAEYKRIGFVPAEMMERLNITSDRGIYRELGG